MRVDPNVRAETEAWFRRRGLPLLVTDYDAGEAWARAAPLLVVVFLAETFNAARLDWSWWANVLALAGAATLVVAAGAVVNLLRGRPAVARPERVGTPEAVTFLAVPPLVPLVFNGQVGSAVVTLVANATLLGAIWLVGGFGLPSMARWAAGEAVRQLGDVVATWLRALPLLLLFVTFLFVNTEAWQVASSLTWGSLALVGGLFFVVGGLFATLRVPRQLGEIHGAGSLTLVSGTPVGPLLFGDPEDEGLGPPPEPSQLDLVTSPAPPLSRRQWVNVGLVVLLSEALQIIAVTFGVGAFFVGFGFLAIDSAVVTSWLGAPPDVLASVHFAGRDMVVTTELLKVTSFLAVFSGLYFTVSLLTDATYREELLDEVVDEVRRALAVRAVYLAAIDHGAATESSTISPT